MSSITNRAAIITACLVPWLGPVRDDVDRVEVNHYYGADGELTFTQLIFYEWESGKWIIRDWRLVDQPGMYPRKDPRSGCYRITWDDKGIMREVRTRSKTETWTDYDPEMIGRRDCPTDRRHKLTPGE